MSSALLFTTGFPDEPALDIAVSAVLHEWVARGTLSTSIRVHPTSRMVAFGRRDTHEPGYAKAVSISRSHSYTPVERLAGGRAAVFHHQTIGLSVVTPETDATVGIHNRFASIADDTVIALTRLGVDARVGEVPGEYCPGEYSINAGGRTKLAGFGQRLIRGSAHVGGVVVVDDVAPINAVLIPVYDALGLDLDPARTGSVSDEICPIPLTEAINTFVDVLGGRWDLQEEELPRALVDAARTRVDSLLSPCT